jgi:hypothetical protein
LRKQSAAARNTGKVTRLLPLQMVRVDNKREANDSPSYFPCGLRFRRKLITVAIRANERTSTLVLSEKFSLLFWREGGDDFLEVRVPAQWVP